LGTATGEENYLIVEKKQKKQDQKGKREPVIPHITPFNRGRPFVSNQLPYKEKKDNAVENV
jgi:hypothetical protein